MFWFRIAIILALTIDLAWAIAHIVVILLQITYGEEQQSMVNDPGLNGTIVAYVFLLIFQFSLVGFVLMGFIICYKVWKNRFQMDHKLRKLFIVWIAGWAFVLLGNLGVAVYCLIRGKDPEGQLGYMHEMFQKRAIDRKFVSTFERYQRDHQCCGIYSPEDWLLVTLRATPGGGTGAMMGGAGSLDYGIQQNPSTGKCYMIGAAFPMGCGPSLMKIVNQRLTLYAGLMLVQVTLGIIAAILAWYCFFYWLEKEVIVIPEDEVSNIIVIEPSDSDTSAGGIGRKPTLLITGSHRYGSGYLKNASYRGGTSGLLHQNGSAGNVSHHSLNHNHHNPNRKESIEFVKPPGPMVIESRVSNVPFGKSKYNPSANLPPGMMNTTTIIPLHHNSYIRTPLSRIGSPNNHKETPLEKQLKTIGGKVLAEMHVDHNLDENGKPKPVDPDEDPKKGGKKKKHATLAIVRNQHKNDPPPKGPPGKHGQTGQLAEDIAAMSGKKAVNKIEDVVIEDGHKKKRPPKIDTAEFLGSVTGINAGSALEGILHGAAVTKAKQDAIEKEKDELRKHMLVKPHYVATTQKLHGHVGSLTGNEQPGMGNHDHAITPGSGLAAGLGSGAGPYHKITLDNIKTHFHNVNDGNIPTSGTYLPRDGSYLRSAKYLRGGNNYLNQDQHGTVTSVRSGHYMHEHHHLHEHETVRDVRSGHYMNRDHKHSTNRIHSGHYLHHHHEENPHHVHSGKYLNQHQHHDNTHHVHSGHYLNQHHQHHGNPSAVHSGRYLNHNQHHHANPSLVHSGRYLNHNQHHHANPSLVHSGRYLNHNQHHHGNPNLVHSGHYLNHHQHHGNPNHVHSGRYLNHHQNHEHHHHGTPKDLHVPHYMKKPATLNDLLPKAPSDTQNARHRHQEHNRHDRDRSNNDISPNADFGHQRNDRYIGTRESYLRPDRFDEPPRRKETSNLSNGASRRDRNNDRDREIIRGQSRNADDDPQPGPSYRKSRDREREQDLERKSETKRKRSENRSKSRTYSKRGDDESGPNI